MDVAADETEHEPVEAQSVLWPAPLAQDAYHGLAGQIVRAVEPHTEADSAALLAHVLVAAGSIVGRSAYFRVGGACHHLNLFAGIVGRTSKGRKGTAKSDTFFLFRSVDERWDKDRILGGLSSGEGLIWAVRDPIFKREPIKAQGRVVDYQDIEIDPGIADKRLLVIESELASVLRVMKRETNTLSMTMRLAWDGDRLQTMNKNSPATASDPHISIIGHITLDELRREMQTTDMANGFANRFLWFCVKRSKLLPDGGNLHSQDFSPIANHLRRVVEKATPQILGELKRDDEAHDMWYAVYPRLSAEHPGIFGSVVGRAEAQVMRLAGVYAVLDELAIIRKEHLRAALAVWEYCEASAKCIFGCSLGDRIADEIMAELTARPTGMTRTDIREHFQHNRSSEQIAQALALLQRNNLAYCAEEAPKDGGKRPASRWFARKEHAINALNAIDPNGAATTALTALTA